MKSINKFELKKIYIKFSEIFLIILSIVAVLILSNFINFNICNSKNDILGGIITVSGVLPGLLLSFIGVITNFPEENIFIKNLKQTKTIYLLIRKISINMILLILVFILSLLSYFISNDKVLIIMSKLIVGSLFSSMILFISIIRIIYSIIRHVENNK